MKKKTFAKQMASIFIGIFLIQAFFIFIICGQYLTEIVKDKILEFSTQALHQTVLNLEGTLGDFKRNVNQMIIDEEFLENISLLRENDSVEAKKQFRNEFRSFLGYRPEVRGMAVMTPERKTFTYDRLEIDSIYQNGLSIYQDYFDTLSWEEERNEDNWFSTLYYDRQGTKDYYLITYNKPLYDWYANEIVGTFLISMDESFFSDICREAQISENRKENYIFITDSEDRILSHWDKKLIGRRLEDIYNWKFEEKGSQDSTHEIKVKEGKFIIQTEQIEENGWKIYNVLDKNYITDRLRDFQKTIIILMVILSICVTILILYVSKRMSKSVENIVSTMDEIQEGKMYVKIQQKKEEGNEIARIGRHFNEMMDTINRQMQMVKESGIREKEAEIKALEAQINPHFIYNTLDSINWLAIENGEVEISNMLSSFAQILRYQISNSNTIVSVSEELEYLEKYLFLQKVRFDDTFEYSIECDASVKNCRLHKMIFQPFIENAIIHGYVNIQYCGLLRVEVCRKDETHFKFIISDNGIGMSQEMLDAIFVKRLNEKKSIGISNVLQRLDIYYGENYSIDVTNKTSGGIQITIIVPKEINTDLEAENNETYSG